MRSRLLLLLLVAALCSGSLASTCVVVEEGPYDYDTPYGEESNNEAMEEEEEGEVIRESDL